MMSNVSYTVPEEETCHTNNVIVVEQHEHLLKLAAKLKYNLTPGHRRQHWFKRHAECFTGMEAVEWMLENMEAKSVREAVRKGQYLLQLHCIETVGNECKFEYCRKRLYRFTAQTNDHSLISSRIVPSTNIMDIPLNGPSRRRAIAALIGAFVAEAASTTWNGVSNPIQMLPDLLHRDIEPAFYALQNDRVALLSKLFPTRSPRRQVSSTGYEARVILQALAARGQAQGPLLVQDIYCGYQHEPRLLSKLGRSFIKRVQSGRRYPHAGVKCCSIDILAFIPIIVALYAGTHELLIKVQEVVQVLYSGQRVLDTAIVAAFILEQIILGSSVLQAMRKSIRTERLTVKQRKMILKAFTKSDLSTVDAIQKFGNKGSLPNGFCGVLQPLLGLNDYTTAIRENMVSGGRTCRRAMFIGACFGAQDGLAAIPEAWVKQTPFFDDVQVHAALLLSRRDGKGQGDDRPRPCSYRNPSYVDDFKNESANELTARMLRVSQLPYLEGMRGPIRRRESDARSDASDAASNYSYTSYTTTGSSVNGSLVDFGDMKELCKPNSRCSSELSQDMLQFYQQNMRRSEYWTRSSHSSQRRTLQGRPSDTKVFFQCGTHIPKNRESNLKPPHSGRPSLYSSMLCTSGSLAAEPECLDPKDIEFVFAERLSLNGNEQQRASLVAIM